MVRRPPMTVLIYGQPGSGKSMMARTYPTPGITFMFDPRGKATPYLKGGTITEEKYFLEEAWPGERGIPYQEVLDPDGKVIWRVEYYGNPNPKAPYASWWFNVRLAQFDPFQYATKVTDSVTSYELSVRKYDEYIENAAAKDGRQHYGASKSRLEEVLMMQMGSWPGNVITIAHLSMEKEEWSGMFIRNPSVVGKLDGRIASYYSEQYYSHVVDDPEAVATHGIRYQILTSPTGGYMAQTHIDAPLYCAPTYDALWVNWDKNHAK